LVIGEPAHFHIRVWPAEVQPCVREGTFVPYLCSKQPDDSRDLGAVMSPHHAWHGPLPAQRFLATRRLPGALCVVSESAVFDNAKAFWIHTAKV